MLPSSQYSFLPFAGTAASFSVTGIWVTGSSSGWMRALAASAAAWPATPPAGAEPPAAVVAAPPAAVVAAPPAAVVAAAVSELFLSLPHATRPTASALAATKDSIRFIGLPLWSRSLIGMVGRRGLVPRGAPVRPSRRTHLRPPPEVQPPPWGAAVGSCAGWRRRRR